LFCWTPRSLCTVFAAKKFIDAFFINDEALDVNKAKEF